MWVFPHQAILQFLADTNRMTYNLIHYDNNYLELVQTPQVKGLVPKIAPNFTCKSQVPGCQFWPIGYNLRAPMTLFLDSAIW